MLYEPLIKFANNRRTIERTKEITHAYPPLTPPPPGAERSYFLYSGQDGVPPGWVRAQMGVPPGQFKMVYPQPGMGYPLPPGVGYAWTGYASCGFSQEDFLVIVKITINTTNATDPVNFEFNEKINSIVHRRCAIVF